MQKLIIMLIIFVICAFAYSKYQANNTANEVVNNTPLAKHYIDTPSNTNTSNFTCDGRKHCSQMTSCQEATFFLKNCPDVKMDGNNDGVPCETQWCR